MPQAKAVASILPGDTIEINFDTCAQCAAVIDVRMNGQSVLPDGPDAHIKHHIDEPVRVANYIEDLIRRGVLNVRITP